MVKAEHMNPATGATGIENNRVGFRRAEIGRDFTVTDVLEGQGRWIARRHDEENKGDEKKWHRNDQQDTTEAADLVGEGLVRMAETRSFEHFGGVEFQALLLRWRSRLTLQQFRGRWGSVTDPPVSCGCCCSGGGRWSLQGLRFLYRLQLSRFRLPRILFFPYI